MDAANLGALTEGLEEYAWRALTPADLVPMIEIDAETSLASMTSAAVKELARLAPFGQRNRRPTFAVTACRLAGPPRLLGARGTHLAMQLTQAGCALRGVWWRRGDQADALARAETLDVAFRPRINTYRGNESVELDVLDVHVGGYRDPTPKT